MTPARPPVDLPAQRLAVVRGLAVALDLVGAQSLTPAAVTCAPSRDLPPRGAL